MVVLDTSILIDHLRREPGISSELVKIAEKNLKEKLAISIITIQELYEGKSSRDSRGEQYLLSIISNLKILPYNFETAKLGGEILRDSKLTMGLADAAIAATTLINDALLATLNKKDFEQVEGLRLF